MEENKPVSMEKIAFEKSDISNLVAQFGRFGLSEFQCNKKTVNSQWNSSLRVRIIKLRTLVDEIKPVVAEKPEFDYRSE